jgi:hypothetical protein
MNRTALLCLCLLLGLCTRARAQETTKDGSKLVLGTEEVIPLQPVTPPPAEGGTPTQTPSVEENALLPSSKLPEEETGEKLEWKWGGKVQSDLRFRAEKKALGGTYDRKELPTGIERNENILQMKLDVSYGKIAGKADVDFVWWGMIAELKGLPDLSLIQNTDPYYLQAHSLYVEIYDFLIPKMDLRVGQQMVLWGKGDRFNPTNHLNANDLEDVLLFGEQLGNIMVKLDYTPFSDWTVSGVLVPVFKPALLPRSAALGLAASDRLPFLDSDLRYRLHFEKTLGEKPLVGNAYPALVNEIRPILPERNFNNMPFSFRLAGPFFEQDVAFSYYRGFSDIPVPRKNYVRQVTDKACRADEPGCLQNYLETESTLGYPRMQAAGFNMAGEMNPLGWISGSIKPIGYRIEVAVVFPEKTDMSMYQDQITLSGVTMDAGEYNYGSDYPSGQRPLVIDDTPFAKWVVGLDYTFGEHVYMNVMWVHGMPDEFGAGDFLHEGFVVRQGSVTGDNPSNCIVLEMLNGADEGTAAARCGRKRVTEVLKPRISDYAVIGLDFKFAGDKALLRLFTILDVSGYYRESWNETLGRRERKYLGPLSEDGFSVILYPEFNYNFGNGLDLGCGLLLQLGKNYTKFGDPAAGGSLVWTRARFQF